MRVSGGYREDLECRFLAVVNQLHHLQALVICDAFHMDGDFGKLTSHPSLQTIKLRADKCTPTAFISVLQLRQLQELWIINRIINLAYEADEVSVHSYLSSTAS